MRVDADNILEAEPCNLGVTKERTLEVVVEAVRVVFDMLTCQMVLISSLSLLPKANFHSLLESLARQRLDLIPMLPNRPFSSKALEK